MSGQVNPIMITRLAGADFSTTGQYRFGTIGADGKIGLTGANGYADGVVCDNPAQDRECKFGIFGVLYVEVGPGGCTAGNFAKSGANGLAVEHDSMNPRNGRFLESGAEGDIVPILFQQR